MPGGDWSRRSLLGAGAAAGALLAACASASAQQRKAHEEAKGGNEELPPTEDLMREHGVLRRVLLVYEEAGRRIQADEELPPDAVAGGADIVRRFIEDYHEKLEEQFLFPRFRQAGQLVELVDTLQTQHEAGRRVTQRIQRLSAPEALAGADSRRQLVSAMQAFARMYRPHAAREDTVLFPALRKLLSPQEFEALGEKFESIEHERFGENGFEDVLGRVEQIERSLGIYDLARFTPA